MRCVAFVLVAVALAGCGSGRRDVAERYVRAVHARDWRAACEVSVRGPMDECIDTLRRVYSDPMQVIPSVDRVADGVHDVHGRKLVDVEYVLIR